MNKKYSDRKFRVPVAQSEGAKLADLFSTCILAYFPTLRWVSLSVHFTDMETWGVEMEVSGSPDLSYTSASKVSFSHLLTRNFIHWIY